VTKFGFKEIGLENWLLRDPVHDIFSKVTPTGEVSPMRGEDWVRLVLKPQILETVPNEIQALFEVARGALIYGYFFYPLWTLGTEQLYRVTEAAVSYKCANLEAPKSIKYFKGKIDWLKNNKVISKEDAEKLNNLRHLRNMASHPKEQSIIIPRMAIKLLVNVSGTINSLFKAQMVT